MPQTLIPKDFALDWTEADEGLLIFDVPVMSYLGKDERPDFKLAKDIDAAWFQGAIKTFEDLRAVGKLPRLLRRHNKPNMEADVIGRLVTLRWEEPWLRADVLVTEPEAIAQVRRGELPSLSAEFDPVRQYLWGLSLIAGEEGHFDRELPDLVLKDQEVAKLSSIPEQRRSLQVRANVQLKEKHVDKDKDKKKLQEGGESEGGGEMSAAELAKAFNDFKAEVMQRIANIEAGLKTQSSGDPAAASQSSDPAKASAGQDKALLARLEAVELDNEVTGMVLKLRAKSHPMTDEELKAKLKECKTSEARKERFEKLAIQPGVPTDEVDKEGEPTTGVKTDPIALALGKEYDDRVKAGAKLNAKREDYIKANYKDEERKQKLRARR